MKNNKLIPVWMLFLLVACFGVQAQSGLEIDKAFEKYGRQKGATLVEMNKESLKEYGFTFYKSLLVKDNKEAADFIRKCLTQDQRGAKKVKQVTSNGTLSTVYLQLPPQNKVSRLVLFNDTQTPEHKTTLIYIESHKESEEVLNFILKRKK